ncbi:MAG: adenine phosphoribosyltransferase [Candidatus Omnitrophica bacterium]|nr:adenine phosphoribosyltransferase [Candidatus Omnitrophota bacterium]
MNATLDLKSYIRDIPDYPKPGILFKDLTPLWQNPAAFQLMIDELAGHFRKAGVETIAAIESRGLILGSAIAYTLKTGLVPIRKEGKLPWKTVRVSYDLEYGQATTEMHVDAIHPGTRVLIVDDLLATGGTAEAAVKLVKELGGEVAGLAFLVELGFLKGRERLKPFGLEVFSLIQYD